MCVCVWGGGGGGGGEGGGGREDGRGRRGGQGEGECTYGLLRQMPHVQHTPTGVTKTSRLSSVTSSVITGSLHIPHHLHRHTAMP